MEYASVIPGTFLSRPNRFIAQVAVNGRRETVHVKNTGRCRELLVPGATVYLAPGNNPARKTPFDLIAVDRDGVLINMDSQAPNKAAGEYLARLYPDAISIRSEYPVGDARLDFLVTLGDGAPLYVEVKGVTLLAGDTALFPDAPTARGVKHLRLLTRLAQEGRQAMVLFIVQMKGARRLLPNAETDPAFAQALQQAAAAGVVLAGVDCLVTPGSMTADSPVPVALG